MAVSLIYYKVSGIVVAGLLLGSLWCFTPVLAQNKSKDKRIVGGTYIANKDGDLGKLLQRTETRNAVGKFVINVTGNLPEISATLSINAYDVDEERGEHVKLYVNKNYAGRLSGTNDSWNTTVFTLDKSWIRKGANEIEFEITDASKKGTIKWSGKIGWGQILIDGGAQNKGEIVKQSLAFEKKQRKTGTTLLTDVLSKVTGVFRLE